MAEDQTLEETQDDSGSNAVEETSEETAEKETQETEPSEPDYKVKFRESQKEAVRLAKELKELKAKKPEPQPEVVETESEGETIDQIVEKKVQEKVAPIVIEQEEKRVDGWLEKNPDAYDYLKEIEDNYTIMPGNNVEQKLENAFLIAKKDAAKKEGKKEMAFELYRKQQASESGGASISEGESLPSLTEEEKKVAQAFGIKEEAYAKNKLKK
jgi:hypothetical protein